MIGQAINENSIDDFTQQELQILSDALVNHKIALREQKARMKSFDKSINDNIDAIGQLQKKVVGFINS